MRFGVCIPNFGDHLSPESIREVCLAAEEVGYDSVWTTDHLVTPSGTSSPYKNSYESVTVLAYAAAVTRRVALGTSIIVLPMRDPVLLAKQLATVDQLSGGRLIAGLAVGWWEEEFKALGASFHDRGVRAEEEIELLRSLWTQPVVDYVGRYYSVRDVTCDPKPEQSGGPPIWIGGNSSFAVRRAAALGNAWHATSIPFDEFQVRVKELRKLAGKRQVIVSSRMTIDLEARESKLTENPAGERRVVWGGGVDGVTRMLREYGAAGLEYLVAYFGDRDAESYISSMQRFARAAFPGRR
ncbi:MAG: TIGR03619 family F420-dependent LLM class oxidoreductase [Conexivisphaerales archaeon]